MASAASPAGCSGPLFRWSGAELAARIEERPVDSPESAAALLELLSGPRAGPPWAPHEPGPGIGPTVAAACDRVCRAASDAGDGQFSIARLFAAISRWAVEALKGDASSGVPEPWPHSATGPFSCSLTAAQCRGILANVLLLNVDDPVGRVAGLKPNGKAGGLRLDRDMLLDDEVGMQKLCCLLQYFATAMRLEGSADDSREVIFERRTSRGADLSEFKARVLAAHPQADSSDGLLGQVTLHSGGMEAPAADAFVNFANAVFGYGEFIASCTQEEIIQVCCPEFNVGMLFIGKMRPDEVIVVHNCRRYSAYRGYLHTFEYTGPWLGASEVQSILTMDACTTSHFSEPQVLRDVQKAVLAFECCEGQVISTGRWGCGVFGGTPAHKFAQQLVAAALVGVERLEFSTFGSPDGCDEVLAVVQQEQIRGAAGEVVSAGRLLAAILDCEGSRPSEFVGRFSAALHHHR